MPSSPRKQPPRGWQKRQRAFLYARNVLMDLANTYHIFDVCNSVIGTFLRDVEIPGVDPLWEEEHICACGAEWEITCFTCDTLLCFDCYKAAKGICQWCQTGELRPEPESAEYTSIIKEEFS